MIRSTKDVLNEKKGIVEALGATVIVMSLILTVGGIIASYALHSQQAGQTTSVKQEIANRAEAYVADLNEDLVNPEVPTTERECSTTTKTCTSILSVTPADDGKKTVLRIQGDSVALAGFSLTQDVTLLSNVVTHVTAIDGDGDNVWVNSGEGLQYKAWSVASGKPSDVDGADLVKGAEWMSVDDRAGVDSTGALWVWGANGLGQAGVGSASDTPIKPKKIDIDGVSFRSVVTGDDRSYAIDSTGFGWVWGKNDVGQLGLGNTDRITVPTKILGKRFISFAIGKDNAFGLTSSGDYLVTGAQQASLSDLPAADSWQQISPGRKFSAIAATTSGSAAYIDTDGRLGQFGTSVLFKENADVTFRSVSLGSEVGYAISAEGDLYSWGRGSFGELGNPTYSLVQKPTKTMSGTKFVSVQGNRTTALAIDTAGQAYYAGQTDAGLLGGTNVKSTTWTKLLAGMQIRSITGGGGEEAATLIDTDGNLYTNGTPAAGLWPITYSGATNQPIRQPIPDGFSSYTWEK